MYSRIRLRAFHHCCLAIALMPLAMAAHAQTAADTERLASASAFLETGGLKIGMKLADIAPATRALNPQLKLTNTYSVTVWPPDPLDMTKTAPPGSPVSPQTLELQTVQGGGARQTNEVLNITLALYPNAPVLMKLNRVMNFPPAAGPHRDQVLQAIIAKFGPATENNVTSDTPAFGMRLLRWWFDRNGKVLPPIAPNTSRSLCPAPENCKDYSLFSLQVTTGAGGIVTAMDYNLWSGPLIDSAQEATDAYLQSVHDNRLKQQNEASKSRALPKL